MAEERVEKVSLATIAREWLRIGAIGFGGPPAHIALLRKLCVTSRGWLSEREFEEGVATTNLLPGPASTQLAIFCAWRLRKTPGAVLGGICFILPGLAIILALSVLFLAARPPLWIEGAAAGAGAAVPAVAVAAAVGLMPGSWERTSGRRARQRRWLIYLLAGLAAAATGGPYLVLVLIFCGAVEVVAEHRPDKDSSHPTRGIAAVPLALTTTAAGGFAALAWVAFKVGALSYGGGFVIIPLMQARRGQDLSLDDRGAVSECRRPRPDHARPGRADGRRGRLRRRGNSRRPARRTRRLRPVVRLCHRRGPHFARLRASTGAQAFLTGAGAAAIGAIMGASIPLALSLSHLWQVGMLALAAAWLLVLRRGVVAALLGAGLLGVIAALAGAPIGH